MIDITELDILILVLYQYFFNIILLAPFKLTRIGFTNSEHGILYILMARSRVNLSVTQRLAHCLNTAFLFGFFTPSYKDVFSLVADISPNPIFYDARKPNIIVFGVFL